MTDNLDVVESCLNQAGARHVCRKTAAALRIERSWTIVVKGMTDDIAIRDAAAADAAVIALIYNQGIEDRLATFETSLRTEADRRAHGGVATLSSARGRA